MTRKELETLAELIAEKLYKRQQEDPGYNLVPIEDASRITGLAVRSLYKVKDTIGYFKRGKKLFFNRKCLEEFNRQREHC